MHFSSELIVLKNIKYSDSSTVVQTYSKEVGKLSLIVYGAHGRKSKFRQSYFLPGTLLYANITCRANRELYSLSSVQVDSPLVSCHTSLNKTSIITLMCELLQRVLKEEEQNADLYEYIKYTILLLDCFEGDFSNFHLVFMMELTRYLGFYPYKTKADGVFYFDLLSGCFSPTIPNHSAYCNFEDSTIFCQLMDCTFSTMHEIALNRIRRNEMVCILIKYYQLHLPGMGNIVSHKILMELFD